MSYATYKYYKGDARIICLRAVVAVLWRLFGKLLCANVVFLLPFVILDALWQLYYYFPSVARAQFAKHTFRHKVLHWQAGRQAGRRLQKHEAFT